MTPLELIECAKYATKNSYAPFSEFNVGAALITKGGKIYKGCNIENSAYSPSICAERVAIFKAISEGETDFEAMAIVGGRNGVFESFCSPCGVCRQVLFEFCKDDFKIILGNDTENFVVYGLKDLLPDGFKL
ncbi:MAG: cytidine deaminase [Oscillospiraceae bacterium]